MAHIYNEYLVVKKGSVMWEYVNGAVDCSNLGKWNNGKWKKCTRE